MKRTTKTILGVALAAIGGAGMLAFASAANTTAEVAHDHTAKVGHAAPDFTLADLGKNEHTLSEILAQDDVNAVVLEWFNPGCPFVKKHYAYDQKTMQDLEETYAEKGVVWLRINSGAPGKQGAGMSINTEAQRGWDIAGPILLDESGEVGKVYDAKTTPHMYVIDSEGVLRYAGAIDNDRSARKFGDVNYVGNALASVLAGETVEVSETRPYGCSVKYGK